MLLDEILARQLQEECNKNYPLCNISNSFTVSIILL